jgi:hypothetical protein
MAEGTVAKGNDSRERNFWGIVLVIVVAAVINNIIIIIIIVVCAVSVIGHLAVDAAH